MRILCKTSGGWIPFVYIRSNSELRKRTTERAGRAVARIMRDLEFLEALDLQYLEQVEALLGKIRSKAIHLDFKLFDARRAAEKRAKNAFSVHTLIYMDPQLHCIDIREPSRLTRA